VTTEQVTRVERKQETQETEEEATEDDTVEKPQLAQRPPARAGGKAQAKTPPKQAYRSSGKSASDAPPPVSNDMCEQIINDAARLMQWGRKWYELAELISRMADRPPLPDVRRVLKDQKANIEKLAGR
jgi:hypothetical protein